MRTELKIEHAQSLNNGIHFYSKRHRGYVAIATIDEKGTIKTEWTILEKQNLPKSKEDKKAELKKTVMYILPIVIVSFLIRNSLYILQILEIVYSLVFLITFLVHAFKERRNEKNSYKFHSAEHMVLNAYRKLKRVPSLTEISQYSRFDNACGTNLTTQSVMNLILLFACSFISNPLYCLLGYLLSPLIVFILIQCGFLNFLQNFTTIKPTDKELLVAIAGMKVWLENEKK